MKRALLTIALLLAVRVSTSADDLIIGAPVGNPITMTGSAIRLVPNPNTARPILCHQIQIQVQPGGNGLVYVLNAAPNVTMAYNGAATTTVDSLGPGTSTQPGQQWVYPSSPMQGANVDMRYIGVYGTGTGPDTVLATCSLTQ